MVDDGFIDGKTAIDELLKRSLSFRDTAEFSKFFNFIARFHHYSRYNTMMVYIQNQAITFFGGVSFWKKKFGRTVKRDARQHIILAPKGPIMLVYDVFETEGKESPDEFMEKGLGGKPFEVRGKLDENIFNHMLDESKKWGVKVSYKPLSYFNAGYITTIFKGYLEIALKEDMSIEENFAVLIHELAHLFLGHTGHKQLIYKEAKKPNKLLQRKLSRTVEELEAETVSYLICHKLGLESRSCEYIAGYITCEKDLLDFSYEVVIKITDKVENLFIRNCHSLVI